MPAAPEYPLISIIMAAHNTERFIGEAIQSVLDQTYPNWELVIVDDASTDGTETVARSFHDPRIIYEKIPHQGRPSAVRKIGFEKSSGSLLLIFDSDDVLQPAALAEMQAKLAENAHYACVYSFMSYIDENGADFPAAGFKLIPDGKGGYKAPEFYQHTWERVGIFKFMASTFILIKRDALAAVGGFDESLDAAEDLHLFLKLFLQDINAIGFVPNYLLKYRYNAQSLTRKQSNIEKLLRNYMRVVDWFYTNPALPAAVEPLKPIGYCKGYNYVAGVCLNCGYKIMALRIVLQALFDSRTTLGAWLKVCGTTLPRCLLPRHADRILKHWAVALRDGVVLNALKRQIWKGLPSKA